MEKINSANSRNKYQKRETPDRNERIDERSERGKKVNEMGKLIADASKEA